MIHNSYVISGWDDPQACFYNLVSQHVVLDSPGVNKCIKSSQYYFNRDLFKNFGDRGRQGHSGTFFIVGYPGPQDILQIFPRGINIPSRQRARTIDRIFRLIFAHKQSYIAVYDSSRLSSFSRPETPMGLIFHYFRSNNRRLWYIIKWILHQPWFIWQQVSFSVTISNSNLFGFLRNRNHPRVDRAILLSTFVLTQLGSGSFSFAVFLREDHFSTKNYDRDAHKLFQSGQWLAKLPILWEQGHIVLTLGSLPGYS